MQNLMRRIFYMKKHKGQNLIEYVVIGSVVIVICIVAIIFFGDSIADMFDNNTVGNIFKSKSRTDNQVKNYNYLSNVKLLWGGKEFLSPLEAKILDDINKNISTTSGAEGLSARDTVDVLSQYIEQLEDVLSKIDYSGNNDLKKALLALIEKAKDLYNECELYAEKDDSVATDENLKTVYNLDISVKLDKDGVAATDFNKALKDVVYLLPEGNTRDIIDIYGSGVLSLGDSLKYKIDSRTARTIGLTDSIKTNSDNFNSVGNSKDKWVVIKLDGNTSSNIDLDGSAVTSGLSLSALGGLQVSSTGTNTEKRLIFKEKPDSVNNSYEVASTISFDTNSSTGNAGVFFRAEKIDGKTNGYSCEIQNNTGTDMLKFYKWRDGQKTEIASAPLSGVSVNSNMNLKINVNGDTFTASVNGMQFLTKTDSTYKKGDVGLRFDGAVRTKVSNFSTEYVSEFENKKALKQWGQNQLNNAGTQISETIDVYRNGNYADLLPESYNSKVLCESLNAEIVNNNCTLD